jgi:XTP/dITP diphosphohydrolase
MVVAIIVWDSRVACYNLCTGEAPLTNRELLIATSNQGKLREIREILKASPFVLSSLRDHPPLEPVAETGDTFAENAALKATGYANMTKVLTLADDSGLEVDVLNGAPGIHSARYLGEGVDYETRNQSLLSRIEQATDRRARFVCAIAIADAQGNLLNVSNGFCEGRIATAQRGSGGFGYDPIFIPDGFELTFAELSAETKDQISHRANALEKAREFLRCLTQC